MYYNHPNFRDYELRNAKVHVTGVAPTAAQGQLYLDTVDSFLKYHDGTKWVSIRDDFMNAGDNISLLVNDAGYLTSFTETDPIFLAHVAAGILASDIVNWNNAYSWGDHALAGYLTSFSEADTLDTVSSRGATTTNNLQVGGLTVTGDLIVSGTTTTINTTELTIQDNIFTLNFGTTGAPTEDAGLVIARGTSTNRGFKWNETTDTWQIQKNDDIYYDIAVVDPIGDTKIETITDSTTITHSFNTNDITVNMYDTVTLAPYDGDWVRTTTNYITVTFYETPTNPIRVIIEKIV